MRCRVFMLVYVVQYVYPPTQETLGQTLVAGQRVAWLIFNRATKQLPLSGTFFGGQAGCAANDKRREMWGTRKLGHDTKNLSAENLGPCIGVMSDKERPTVEKIKGPSSETPFTLCRAPTAIVCVCFFSPLSLVLCPKCRGAVNMNRRLSLPLFGFSYIAPGLWVWGQGCFLEDFQVNWLIWEQGWRVFFLKPFSVKRVKFKMDAIPQTNGGWGQGLLDLPPI